MVCTNNEIYIKTKQSSTLFFLIGSLTFYIKIIEIKQKKKKEISWLWDDLTEQIAQTYSDVSMAIWVAEGGLCLPLGALKIGWADVSFYGHGCIQIWICWCHPKALAILVDRIC
jgi:hypothetical protein